MLVYLITNDGSTYMAETDNVEELIKKCNVEIIKILDMEGNILWQTN